MVLTGEFFETASHWVMAAGVVLAAYGILRSRARLGKDVGEVDVPFPESAGQPVG